MKIAAQTRSANEENVRKELAVANINFNIKKMRRNGESITAFKFREAATVNI